jgi:hypothetical protein
MDLFDMMVRFPATNSATTVRWYSSPRARAEGSRMMRECQVRICERLGVVGHQSQDRKGDRAENSRGAAPAPRRSYRISRRMSAPDALKPSRPGPDTSGVGGEPAVPPEKSARLGLPDAINPQIAPLKCRRKRDASSSLDALGAGQSQAVRRGGSIGGVPSFIAPLIICRRSGVSWCLCTATACWTAASNNSASLSALRAIVQFISLGNARQSMNLRPMISSRIARPNSRISTAQARTTEPRRRIAILPDACKQGYAFRVDCDRDCGKWAFQLEALRRANAT